MMCKAAGSPIQTLHPGLANGQQHVGKMTIEKHFTLGKVLEEWHNHSDLVNNDYVISCLCVCMCVCVRVYMHAGACMITRLASKSVCVRVFLCV
jgi:hypothetical protein